MQQQQRVPAVYWYFSAIFLLFLGYYYKSKAVSLRSVLLAFSTAFFPYFYTSIVAPASHTDLR
jgi:hypothetical protein